MCCGYTISAEDLMRKRRINEYNMFEQTPNLTSRLHNCYAQIKTYIILYSVMYDMYHC